MIDWIIGNKEWLFSGAGVAIVAGLSKLLYNKRHGRARPSVSGGASLVSMSEATLSGEGNPTITRYQGRILVDVAPDYLTGLFKDQTSIQAQKLVAAYVGKWMKVSGALGDVISTSKDRAQVTFATASFTRYFIFMYFHGEEQLDLLSVLRRGQHVTVLGQVKDVNVIELHLDNCDIVES